MITNVSKENNLGPGDKPEFRGERCRTCPRVGGGGVAQVQHQLQQWAKYWYSIVWDVLTQSIYKG